MKKIIFILKISLLLIVLQSCERVRTGDNNIPVCEWDENNPVVFYDLQLQHPSGISTFHRSLIPLDNIERSLLNIVETNGDAPNNKKIRA